MDVQVVALAAVTLLGPYLTKAGEAAAKSIGEKTTDKMGELYQAIKNKFKGDAYAEQTLTRVEEKPEAEGRQIALKEALAEKLAEDDVFAAEVQKLIADLRSSSGSITITGDGNVVGDSSSAQVIKAGGDIGDVTQTKSS